MKPKHQLAPPNSDIYCLSAASLRGGREYGGDKRYGGTSVVGRRLSLPSVGGKHSPQRKSEGEEGGGRAESGIMRGKSIGGGKKKHPSERREGEREVRWAADETKQKKKQRYNINVNVTSANRSAPLLYRHQRGVCSRHHLNPAGPIWG